MAAKSDLKAEAEKIIGELRLIDLLSRYGRTGVVGSVAYDLIVKLDIDIHLLIPEGTDLLNTVDSIYHQLLDHEHVREVRISDYREDHAVKIGIDRYSEKSETGLLIYGSQLKPRRLPSSTWIISGKRCARYTGRLFWVLRNIITNSASFAMV